MDHGNGKETARYTKLLAAHERNEKRLVRAQNAWQKTRAAVKAMEARLDKKVIGGEADLRELACNGTRACQCPKCRPDLARVGLTPKPEPTLHGLPADLSDHIP